MKKDLSPTVQTLIATIKKAPPTPGVYLFKDQEGAFVYIGKAKNLKNRLNSYIQNIGLDVKVDSIFSTSATLEFIQTESELEALMMEAKLVLAHQPTYNVLLKHGQPFLYLFIDTKAQLPMLKIVRNKKQKGTYFGPFLEKNMARKVYHLLTKTFRLYVCNKKIENGCLYYHLGLCCGSCRKDFDKQAYHERMELARQILTKKHDDFLFELKKQIDLLNKKLAFEKARDLHNYYVACERIFDVLKAHPSDFEHIGSKDLWIFLQEASMFFLYSENNGVLKKIRVFTVPPENTQDDIAEYLLRYYQTYLPPATILTNIDLKEQFALFSQFFKQWHNLERDIVISCPSGGHYASLVRLGILHAQQELKKQKTLGTALKTLLKLSLAPRTIDCFDISHKQGMFMVGSCVRFTDGTPDKNNVRRFYIKTVTGQDDYASLREIVERRYKDGNFPDLIVIDGGKGQLHAVADLVGVTECISLAKREETVFSKKLPKEGKVLDQKSIAGQQLIALRDYAHHFAISFHRHVAEKEWQDQAFNASPKK